MEAPHYINKKKPHIDRKLFGHAPGLPTRLLETSRSNSCTQGSKTVMVDVIIQIGVDLAESGTRAWSCWIYAPNPKP